LHYEYDKYSYLSSPVHKWDARYKTAALFTTGFSLSFVRSTESVFSGFLLAITVLLISKIPLRFVLKKLSYLLPFFLMMLIIMPLTFGKSSIFKIAGVNIYSEGILHFSLITVRVVSAVIVFTALFASERFNITLKALVKLGVSDKIISILLISHNYIYNYREKLRRLTISAALRGSILSKGLKKYKLYSGIIVNLLITSLEQSQRLSSAMELRGFEGENIKLHNFNSSKSDIIKFAVTLLFTFSLLALEFSV
jgi:cobalt/nickel transport system permease protein